MRRSLILADGSYVSALVDACHPPTHHWADTAAVSNMLYESTTLSGHLMHLDPRTTSRPVSGHAHDPPPHCSSLRRDILQSVVDSQFDVGIGGRMEQIHARE
jgi:hypothetical protein